MATQKSALDKTGGGMTDEAPFPSEAQLTELLDRLLPENEDMDSVSASIILEDAGVDRMQLATALRSRLQSRIGDMTANREDVPPVLSEVVAALDRNIEAHEKDFDDPDNWIDALLSGRYPESQMGPAYIEAFRPRGTDPLTEEDIQILKELESELEA